MNAHVSAIKSNKECQKLAMQSVMAGHVPFYADSKRVTGIKCITVPNGVIVDYINAYGLGACFFSTADFNDRYFNVRPCE